MDIPIFIFICLYRLNCKDIVYIYTDKELRRRLAMGKCAM